MADSPTPDPYPPLLVIEWVDITDVSEWSMLDAMPDWANDGGFLCRTAGWLAHEDDLCVVLASRVALEEAEPQVGMYERIPKGVILTRWVLQPPVRGRARARRSTFGH